MEIERQQFGGLVFSVSYDFARLERNFCKFAGLYPGQPRILTILQKNEGVTLSELSPLCNIGMPSLSVSLRNLQKSGLVRKEGTGKNLKIYLTDVGRQRAYAFHLQIDAFYQEFLEHLGPEAAWQLQNSLNDFDDFLKAYSKEYELQHGWKTR